MGCTAIVTAPVTLFLVRDSANTVHAFIGEDPRNGCALVWFPESHPPTTQTPNLEVFYDTCHGSIRLRGVALVHAEGEKAPSPIDTVGATAPFVYVRLRAEAGYDGEAVARWATRLRTEQQAGRDVYAYFKHDDGSNGLSALRLRAALATNI